MLASLLYVKGLGLIQGAAVLHSSLTNRAESQHLRGVKAAHTPELKLSKNSTFVCIKAANTVEPREHLLDLNRLGGNAGFQGS